MKNNYKDIGNDNLAEISKEDIQSHFILRLAFCKTEENQKWFVKYEGILLKNRVSQNNSEINNFLQKLNIFYENCDYEIWDKYQNDILNSNIKFKYLVKENQFKRDNFYKVNLFKKFMA